MSTSLSFPGPSDASERPIVLVVDDDDAMREMLHDELDEAGYHVVTASGGDEALEQLARARADVVVTDMVMPSMQGRELLVEIHAQEPDLPVVIITAFGSIDSAVEAIKDGAYSYVTKPFEIRRLRSAVADALRERRVRRRVRKDGTEAGVVSGITARSPAMARLMDLMRRTASVDTPVLLLGESGTGKELLARAIHLNSRRSGRRFVPVNCSAIPETLLESQLFGHRRGAFTDAREDRLGLFQEAEGGTLLLDEIGDMPPPLQVKLLRVLQEREVHPVGAPGPVPVNVRTIAATHRDLEALVGDGRFRQDLYYRLNVLSLHIPPLRERPEDLLPLVSHFLDKHGGPLRRPGCTVSAKALDMLAGYSWPGNVRELENAIERALVVGTGSLIRPEDFPMAIRSARPSNHAGLPVRPLREVERDHILTALRAAGGNKTAAARLLGMDRKTLYRKLSFYGIRD